MVEFELPPEMVEKVRRVVGLAEKNDRGPAVYRILGGLKNVDHRKDEFPWRNFSKNDTRSTGRRIRLIIFQRWPKSEVIIKRIHSDAGSNSKTAEEVISELIRRVKKHNRSWGRKGYILREPIAYAIGTELAMMAKTTSPTLLQVLRGSTNRGMQMQESLATQGITVNALNRMGNIVDNYLKNGKQNIIVSGIEKGKIVLIPLLDLG